MNIKDLNRSFFERNITALTAALRQYLDSVRQRSRFVATCRAAAFLRNITALTAAFRQCLDSVRQRPRFVAVCCATAFLLMGSAAMSLYLSLSGPQSGGSLVCLPVNMHTVSAKNFPQGPATRFPFPARPAVSGYSDSFLNGKGGSMITAAVTTTAAVEEYRFSTAAGSGRAAAGLVLFSHGRVSIDTVDGAVSVAELRHSPLLLMPAAPDIFQADMFTAAPLDDDLPPLLYGEETDDQGRPRRWLRPANALPDNDLLACSLQNATLRDTRRLIRGISIPFTGTNFAAQAARYKQFVSLYAEKYDLAAALVLAIMHTESNFNPFAVSRSQAVGLMQIVPATAGNEVHRYLTGMHGAPSQDTLFSPEHNIKYGTVYLHLLSRRYFGNVTNPASRQMCIVAAYNGGPGAVLRLFDDDHDAAVARINTLSPEALYTALTTEMPRAETRRYVELVLGRMRNYSAY